MVGYLPYLKSLKKKELFMSSQTNKYNMSLLDIIGVSCFNTSFYFEFVFLERKDEYSYILALSVFKKTLENREPSVIMSDRELSLMNAIKTVFPNTINLLCIWHIEKNVLANCKKHFTNTDEFDIFMSNWNNVAYSTTSTIFESTLGEFELLYQTRANKSLLVLGKKNYLHFGNRSSSRAEGAHSKLKSYLQVSTGGFQGITEKFCLAIRHKFNEIKVKLANKKVKVLRCDTPLEQFCTDYIMSHFALKKIYIPYEKVKKGTMAPWADHFMVIMGLPCAHKMQHL
uniref:MULE transposase domain-containing protein n=1 Tax=Lactuca sativa TaxID=4236 RepID=A0A9R1WJZ2_LACSA|nr:hypothetical protein LSAT_V11C200072610 [Lactuca sativa]